MVRCFYLARTRSCTLFPALQNNNKNRIIGVDMEGFERMLSTDPRHIVKIR